MVPGIRRDRAALAARPKSAGAKDLHIEDLAGFRQTAYGLFSSMLIYPDEARLAISRAAAVELRKQAGGTLGFAFTGQWQRFLASLTEVTDHRALGEEYVRLFMHNPALDPCLPYESVYANPEGGAAPWIMTLLEQEYASAGLWLSPSTNDMPDHVAVELEFMAFLCGKEADAWNGEDIGEGLRYLELQSGFLNRHLVRWFPTWARKVIKGNDGGVYAIVAEAAQAFIVHDQDLVGVLLSRLREAPAVSGGSVGSEVLAGKQ